MSDAGWIGHDCNAWCGNGEHCDIAFCASEGSLRYWLRQSRGHLIQITRLELAPEAPAPWEMSVSLTNLDSQEQVDRVTLRQTFADARAFRYWYRLNIGVALRPAPEVAGR